MGKKKKDGKIKRQSGRVSESGKGRREGGADEKSKRRGREEVTVITLN